MPMLTLESPRLNTPKAAIDQACHQHASEIPLNLPLVSWERRDGKEKGNHYRALRLGFRVGMKEWKRTWKLQKLVIEGLL